MITSDKFQNSLGEFRSRLYSPVFAVPAELDRFCFSFKFNIYSSSTDGFRVGLENYGNHAQTHILKIVLGPFGVDRWYSDAVEITAHYPQNRVCMLYKTKLR